MAKVKLQEMVDSTINVSLRKGKIDDKLDAKEALNKKIINELVNKDSAFKVFKNVRSSPAYWQNLKNQLLAMIRQLGKPTFFITLSANEFFWPELLIVLMLQVKNKIITIEEALNLNPAEKAELIKADPVTCVRYFHERVHKFFNYLQSNDGPFKNYKVIDYFIRHEFQMRGSPHVHCLLWLNGAPDPDENPSEYIKFLDEFISCVNDDSIPYIRCFNKHKHTFSCYKGRIHEKICRFNFPKYPIDKTQIIEPFDNQEKSTHMKENLKDNLEKNRSLIYNYSINETCDTIDEMLVKLNMTRAEYILFCVKLAENI
jgi:hypothetical protein